jgi:hypothetical protein
MKKKPNQLSMLKKSVVREDESGKIDCMPQFKPYSHVFDDLTTKSNQDTTHPLVNVVITQNSKHCIAIAEKNDEHFEIQGFNLLGEKYRIFTRVYHGKYLKMNLIEQNAEGTEFSIGCQDNGHFKVIFVNDRGEELDVFDVSEFLKIDSQSTPITGFQEPLITTTYISGRNVFVQAYHRIDRKHYHFLYNYESKQVQSAISVSEIKDCSNLNFPVKSFYSSVSNHIYTFYRQGQCITTNASNTAECKYENLPINDMGTMYLLFEKALIVRSSSSILFFKVSKETGLWTQYKRIDKMRGEIYFIKGNVRIQITTDRKIYFYLIDQETCEPTLENVMYNYMNCSQMMFGPRVRSSIVFKQSQIGFSIYQRKMFHNFKVTISDKNYEGA